ncbi:PEP-CTERM sorting domain-containing protein [Gloeothece citriformis]|uniref:PEP-CTERM sorting domain-containing protein n=1 Tax=Gloeothece citriformis TaxID=2546356 RepID=UPI001EF1235F|nr:PEP-CTERM sorting domain-containing protein [Gloeothece citriformis]
MGLPLCFLWIPTTQAFTPLSVTFTKIADTNTLIPDGNGNFTGFGVGSAVIYNNTIGFIGSGENQTGIYMSTSPGFLTKVADTNTPIPNDTTNFTGFGLGFFSTPYNFGSLGIQDNKVVFNGYGETGNGIYTGTDSGMLTIIADETTVIPGTSSTFTTFSSTSPDLDQHRVAFWGNDGIYRGTDPNSISLIANNQTSIPPNNNNTFAGLFNPSLKGEMVAFNGFFGGQTEASGIYMGTSPNSLNVVVDTNTLIPQGIGNFRRFGAPALEEGRVAFRGEGFNFQEGIYLGTNPESLSVIADNNTFIPNGIGKFINFGNAAFDKDTIAFWAEGEEGQQGIYLSLNGKLYKVIDLKDSLEGKTLSSLEFASSDFNTSNRGLSGNSLVFLATFTDNSQGIYQASIVPEPSTKLGVGTALTLICFFKLKKGIKRPSNH